jgi:hypothetical protein
MDPSHAILLILALSPVAQTLKIYPKQGHDLEDYFLDQSLTLLGRNIQLWLKIRPALPGGRKLPRLYSERNLSKPGPYRHSDRYLSSFQPDGFVRLRRLN